MCSCVRRLHPDLRQRVREDTLLKYQKSFEAFTDYLQKQYDLVLTSPEDLDLLMMEYRTEAELTRAQHISLVASAEFFLPNVKGKLVTCREALRGRACGERVKHTIPLTLECCFLFSTWHASEGRQRVGAAMLVQHSTGLRPSELLALQPEHIHLPLDRMQSLTIRLGATYSTKVKREQYVLVDPVSQPLAFSLVARLCIVTPRGSRLFPFGYQTYNNAFKLAEAHYDLHLGTTAHSGRAGFATHQVLQGCPRKEVQARGRWLSESSFNTYIDVSGASHIAAQVSSRKLAETAQWLERHIWQYFSLKSPDVVTASHSIGGGPVGQTGLQVQASARPYSRTTRLPVFTPKETVETRQVDRAFWSAGQPSSATSSRNSSTAKGKGKGRGVLRRRGNSKSSIFD